MSDNLVSFNVMVRSDRLVSFALQQPLETIIKQLSTNYTFSEIMEAATKVEREKIQQIVEANNVLFQNQIAELQKAHNLELEKLRSDRQQILVPLENRASRIVTEVQYKQKAVLPVTRPTKKPLREFVCNYKGCGQVFSTGERKAKYCSRECRNKQFKIKSEQLTTETRNCLNCETPFQVSVFGKNKKYCSIICSSTHYRATHKEQIAGYTKKHKNKQLLLSQENSTQDSQEAERLAQ